MKCVYNYCLQSWVLLFVNIFPSICKQSIPNDTNLSYISIGIDNQYQSITTRIFTTQIFTIDWSSIININRLIDINWYRLISIVIDYRFCRLDTLGSVIMATWTAFATYCPVSKLVLLRMNRHQLTSKDLYGILKEFRDFSIV